MLKLSLGALAGARELTVAQIQARVASRYPDAAPLPGRPELDALLAEAGSELRWQQGSGPNDGVYVAPLREFTTVYTGTRLLRTSTSPTPRAGADFEEVSVDKADLKQFRQRLQYSIDQQHFVALIVSPRRAQSAERLLTAEFPVDVCSFDELLIRHMKSFAAEKNVDWRQAATWCL